MWFRAGYASVPNADMIDKLQFRLYTKEKEVCIKRDNNSSVVKKIGFNFRSDPLLVRTNPNTDKCVFHLYIFICKWKQIPSARITKLFFLFCFVYGMAPHRCWVHKKSFSGVKACKFEDNSNKRGEKTLFIEITFVSNDDTNDDKNLVARYTKKFKDNS